MEDIQAKLGAILNDPETMQKIMSMAQAMGQTSQKESPQQQESSPSKPEQHSFSLPDIDLGAIQKIAGMSQKASIDNNQKALLRALGPYLSRERVSKLERAMRAARMASLASSFLGSASFLSNQGR